jgi:hypothetical protein
MPGSRTGLPAPAAGQYPANPTTSPVTSAMPANLFNAPSLESLHGHEKTRRIIVREGRTRRYADSEVRSRLDPTARPQIPFRPATRARSSQL